MTTELNDNERALLAREVAADRAGYTAASMSSWRLAFMKGWEAAVEYMEKRDEDRRLDDWQRGYEAGMNDG